MSAHPSALQESSGTFDLKEPYYRQLTPAGWYVPAGDAAAEGLAAAAAAPGC
jgi:hypothetical protein